MDAINCSQRPAMNDENQALRELGCKPVVVHPGPLSIDDLLRHVDPAPDGETERFVAAIYADRREAAAIPPPE
jgi:hypothetical protein